jgi:hypothetical protein
MLRFLVKGLRIIAAAALIVAAVAVMSTAGRAFAHSRTSGAEVALNQPAAGQSCAAFEAWFLDPACSQGHVKKAAHAKHRLAHKQ